jgi:hypothetical protein
MNFGFFSASLYAPRKDYEANRMERGLLHCAPGTQVLVDETLLTPGQLMQPVRSDCGRISPCVCIFMHVFLDRRP